MPWMKTTKCVAAAVSVVLTLIVTASSGAVVGGSAASESTGSSLAFIADTQSGIACTGTVISPLIVLTAAHCVEDLTTGLLAPASAFQVVTGRLDWTDPGSGQLLDVTRVIVNPGYTLTTFGTDAALLVLATPTDAPAIALASPADSALIDPGTVASVAGWGDTSGASDTPPTALQSGTTVVQSSTYCAAADTADEIAFDPSVDLCALDTADHTTAVCHGDSGGPLIVNTSGGPIEIAVTSRGDADCAPDEPSTFTAAQEISAWAADWIAQYPSAGAGGPAPVPAPAPLGGAAAKPKQGVYSGGTRRHAGAVSLTVAAGGGIITRLKLRFTLRCAHGGPSGDYKRTVARTLPLTLSDSAGVNLWRFATSYRDARHWRYAVSGQLRGDGKATGTLDVSTPHGRCTTGRIAWTAGDRGA
jgi:secreted trypsin-like serine protease